MPTLGTLHRSYATHASALEVYIFYSTIVGVFSAAAVFTVGFDIRFFDFILLSNFLLISLIIDLSRPPRWAVALLLYLLLSGLVGILRDTDSFAQVAKQWLGISASLLYFIFFYRFFKNDCSRMFRTYARLSYYFCLCGFPLVFLASVKTSELARLQSLALEPSHFCELVLPAYFWYGSQFLFKRKYGREVLLISLAIALSRSSLGFMGIGFGIVFLPFRRRAWMVVMPILAAGLLAGAYFSLGEVKVRVDDTFLALSKDDLSEANVSTYALVSNMMVTQSVFKESPWIGNGLGSHVVSYRRLVADVPGIQSALESYGEFNATEAASLALRTLSEQGLLGLALLLMFLFRFYVMESGELATLNHAVLVCFFIKILRDGSYFGPEQFFFALLYLRSSQQAKALFAAKKLALRGTSEEPQSYRDTGRAIEASSFLSAAGMVEDTR